MPGFVHAAVTEHCDRPGLAGQDVLCQTARSGLLRRDYFNREIWKPAISAAHLPDGVTYHDLRHTFASTALAEGVPISEVWCWLGHRSITTTVDLYGHLVPEPSGRARDALDKAFAGLRVCPQYSLSTVVAQVRMTGEGRAGL
jgi:site-specific recombinase XerD